jgi:hypothetical protein
MRFAVGRFVKLRDKYLTIDPRGLGVGRIVLAAVLLLDLARRVPSAALWYSNQGLLPNHTVLWRPPFAYAFSFFFMASEPFEAAILVGFCGIAYLMLLLGIRTRAAQVASLLAVLSLHGRVQFIQNSGDIVLVEICLWTVFLPLGARYSVDAAQGRAAQTPVVSFAVLALVGQVAAIYFYNALWKHGVTWRDGSAVHYSLQYACVVSRFGVWARDWITPKASRFLTWSARATEALLPVVLLSPVAQRQARRLAIALMIGLHGAFGLFLDLGIFVPAMLTFTPFLVPAADWDLIERWWAGGNRGRALQQRLAHALAAAERSGLLRSPTFAAPAASPSPFSRARWTLWREGTALVLMAIATMGALVDNSGVTHVPESFEPRAANALRVYLQLFQSWGMFAPDAPRETGTLAVDAVTSDGRHVDPLNQEFSSVHSWLGERIPERLGYDTFASAYVLRMPTNPDYFNALGEWLLRYPERTGREADRIKSFRVLDLEQEVPRPGERQAGKPRATVLFAYPD